MKGKGVTAQAIRSLGGGMDSVLSPQSSELSFMLWRDSNFLWLLLAVVGLGGGLFLLLRRQEARLAVFAEEALARRLTPNLDRRRRVVRVGLRVAALLLVVLALAGPKWGFHWEEVKREGIDLIVAIDTSRSMLATDVKPNRLERAKLAVLDLVDFLQGDRIGLVAFAGTAFLECPLTLDYAAFARSLRATEVGLIPRGGTALARAIETSLAGFEAREGKHEALILITDGEDHEGDLDAAVQQAVEKGVRIYTVGIGTSEGELVPQAGGGGGYVKDRSGQVVKSRLNEEVLKDIALKTDGAYVRGLGAALGLDEVFRDHIAKMERREVASSLERRYEDRFQIPLLLAILFLVAESLIGDRKSTRLRAATWLRPWAWLFGRRKKYETPKAPGGATLSSDWRLSVLILLSLPFVVGWLDPPGDRAAEGNRLYDEGKYEEAVHKYGDGLVDAPESPLLQFNMGTALYKEGKYSEAIASLSKVASGGDDAWTARAAYNLGNSYYRLGANSEESDPQAAIQDYEQALAAYKRAMGVAPQDTDAKFNHEFVAKKLADLKKRLEEQQQEQEQQQDQQQKQDEKQQEEEEQQNQQQQNEQQQNGEEQNQAQQNQEEQDEQQPEQQEQQQRAGEQESQQEEQASRGEQPQGGEQPEAQQAQGGAPQGDEEAQQDQQAAQAVLDTAREEELSPEDIQRPMGAVGVGAPAQDW